MVGGEYQLHLAVQRMLVGFGESTPARMLNHAQYLRVLAMLQSANAEKSDSALLRYDLAAAYIALENYPRAVEVYRSAMRDFPNHVLTRKTRFDYAIACGKVGDHECEARVYREILAQETEADERSIPTLNLAETEMHNRELREAIEDYRETYRLCGSFQSGYKTPALALWGLAVALDRAGETREAEEAAAQALAHAGNHTLLLHDVTEGIFFVPEYEVSWYDAITAAAQARRAQGVRERVTHWREAERFMAAWVTGGTRKKDYWLPIAKTRLATYKAERERAEAELAKLPLEQRTDLRLDL